MRFLRWLLLAVYTALATLPLFWMALTSFKTRDDSISQHARFVPVLAQEEGPQRHTFVPTTSSYAALSTVHAGASSSFWSYLRSSVVIGTLSTLASVLLGTLCAYGFSRFRI